MTWIFLTILAAFMQSWRNALQSKLSAHVSVAGVTLARFILASPLALAYLISLYLYQDAPLPTFNLAFISYIVGASIVQIIATGLMVTLFKMNNFAVGAGLAKSEALVAAILGVLFFGATLSLLGWLGVFIGSIAVLLLSTIVEKGTIKNCIGSASSKSYATGVQLSLICALDNVLTKYK